MIVKSFKTRFINELSSLYDEYEIESFFYLILENIHQKKRIDIALHPETEIDSVEMLRWENCLAELKKQKPIQYILGQTAFYGLPFLVNENVLIPRPETEELVDLIISNYKLRASNSSLKILDIGTGSGCIAISLKKNLSNAEVFAIDVSEKALETAKNNAQSNQVEINFMQVDILKINDLNHLPTDNRQQTTDNGKQTTDNRQQSTPFNLIVSNPPYIRSIEKSEINPNVLDYEPHLALFVEDNDALIFYRKIAQLALRNLAPNGQLYFEINQYLGKETVELIESIGFKNVQLYKDIYGNDRMIVGTKYDL